MSYLNRSLIAVAAAWALTLPAIAEDAAKEAKPEKPKIRQFTGEITALNAAAKTVAVKNKQNVSKEFVCDPACKVSTADKKAAELADLKVGDRATVHFREEDGKNLCVKIVPPAPPKEKAPAEKKE
jgi:hypothetical protein